jgi:hypothetical protein
MSAAYTPASASTDADHELLATELRPLTDATLTIRIIKNFPFRTTKNLVLRDVDLTTMTVGGLMDKCREGELDVWACGGVVWQGGRGWAGVEWKEGRVDETRKKTDEQDRGRGERVGTRNECVAKIGGSGHAGLPSLR